VAITIDRGTGQEWRIQGTCQLTQEHARSLAGTVLHQVFVQATCGSGPTPLVVPVVAHELVFPEDIATVGNFVRGCFQADLASLGITSEPPVHIVASFGVHLSAVWSLRVGATEWQRSDG
jgi:hypothetical protein